MPETKRDLSGVIKMLRVALHLSQQAFAVKLNTSMRTVAHWEAGRKPGFESLLRLRALAAENAMPEVAIVFQDAIAEEFDIPSSVVMRDVQDVLRSLFRAALKLSNPKIRARDANTLSEQLLKDLMKLAARLDADEVLDWAREEMKDRGTI